MFGLTQKGMRISPVRVLPVFGRGRKVPISEVLIGAYHPNHKATKMLQLIDPNSDVLTPFLCGSSPAARRLAGRAAVKTSLGNKWDSSPLPPYKYYFGVSQMLGQLDGWNKPRGSMGSNQCLPISYAKKTHDGPA